MAAADPEVTLICIDNSEWVFDRAEIHKAQLEAIKYYCETKFECNQENTVAIFSMSSERFGPQLSPTRDLRQIMMVCEDVYYAGSSEFTHAAASACVFFSRTPPNMKKRLLMCVGGPINIVLDKSEEGYVAELKQLGVALDIVNLFVLHIDESSPRQAILYGTYRYARRDLHKLAARVNGDDGGIHIVDVKDEASVIPFLANSILKESLQCLGKNVEASGIQFVKPYDEQNESAEENIMPGMKYIIPRKNTRSKPKAAFKVKTHNEDNISAADAEHFKAPAIKYPTKRTPFLPGNNSQNKPKADVKVKKNQAVA